MELRSCCVRFNWSKFEAHSEFAEGQLRHPSRSRNRRLQPLGPLQLVALSQDLPGQSQSLLGQNRPVPSQGPVALNPGRQGRSLACLVPSQGQSRGREQGCLNVDLLLILGGFVIA